MSRSLSSLVISCLHVVIFYPHSLPAQDQDQEKRAIQYISNIQTTFRQIIASTTSAGKQTEFLLRLPGLPIDPKMDLSKTDARLEFFRILGQRPLGDLSGQTSQEQMSAIYREILNDTEPTVKPDQAQIDALKSQLDKIDDELLTPPSTPQGQPTGILPAYQKYNADYQNALQAYNAAIREGQTGEGNKGTDIELRRSQMQTAESLLDNKNGGKRQLYLDKLSEQDNLRFQLDKLDPFSYRKNIFQAWLETKGPPPIPRVLFYPPLAQWADDSGFINLNFSSEVLNKNEGTRSVSHEASGGWFVFKGSAGGSFQKTFTSSQLSSLSIQMEIKQIVLDNIWMDSTVFASTNWKWKTPAAANTPAAARQVISEGGPRTDGLYYGRLPLIPVGLIVGRNIKISLKMDKQTADDIRKQIKTGGGGSFLGFSFGTNTSWSNTDKSTFGDVSEAGFEIKAPTIIGYICEVVPKCPASQPAPQ